MIPWDSTIHPHRHSGKPRHPEPWPEAYPTQQTFFFLCVCVCDLCEVLAPRKGSCLYSYSYEEEKCLNLSICVEKIKMKDET